MKKLSFAGLKGRVSWGSVFGGVMTVLAISVLLSILNSSIGLFMFDPLSDHPVAGIGTAVGIGSAIILVAGMAAGGFVAGKLAGMDGMIHGISGLGDHTDCGCGTGNFSGCRCGKNDGEYSWSGLVRYGQRFVWNR